jgi:hypothetical protein
VGKNLLFGVGFLAYSCVVNAVSPAMPSCIRMDAWKQSICFDNLVVWVGLEFSTSVAQKDRTVQSLKMCLFSSEARVGVH